MRQGAGRNEGSTARPRGAGGALAAPWRLPVPRAPGLVSVGVVHWLAVEYDRECAARSLFNWLPVAAGAGILAFFAADRQPVLPVVLVVWVLTCLATIMLRRHAGWFHAALVAATVLSGFASAALRTVSVAAPQLQRTTVTRMTALVETAEEGVSRHRLLLRPLNAERIAAGALPVRVRVSLRGPLNVQAGDLVSVTARLLPPPRPILPGGYDFARDSYFKQIGAVGSLAGRATILASPAPMPLWLQLSTAIDRTRNDLTTRIAMLIGGQEGALTAAMITGKRGLIEEPRNADMRAAGIYHIVSISGLHMVLAAGIFLWLVRAGLALCRPLAARLPIKKIAAAIAMAGATAYCIFSGSEVATVRSLVMTLAILGAVLCDRPALSMRNLAISALIVMAIEPEEVLGPSFQMSFAAVAALIAGSGLLRFIRSGERDGLARRIALTPLLWLGASIGTTLLATAATAPYSAFHFHQFNPYGVLGNAVAIPVMEMLVMPASIAGLALLPFGLDGPVWWLTGFGVRGVLAVAHAIAGIPGARLAVAGLDGPAIAAFSAGFLLLVLLAGRLRYLGLPLLLASAAIAATPRIPDIWIDRRGDAVAVKGADGRLQVFGPGVSAFTLSNWLPAAGDNRVPGDPGLHSAVHCDSLGCTAPLPGGDWLSLVRQPIAFETDCVRAAIVVTPMPAPAWCHPRIALIDYRVLARNGSMLANLDHGRLDIRPSRVATMDRPWWPAFRPYAPRPVQ